MQAPIQPDKPKDYGLPSWVVCPQCRGPVESRENWVTCRRCGRRYDRKHGFLNLLLDAADVFQDERQEERDLKEENANQYSTLNFCLPLLQRLFGDGGSAGRHAPPRILSSACGVGVDVDLLTDRGFDTYGFDCGERTWIWSRRRYPERLFVANAKALPFADAAFDFINSGCLLPHVGVFGDTTRVTPDYREQRLRVARELVRVLNPGGYILMNNPNRLCPLDLHHLQPHPNRLARLHSPTERFLLSLDDHRELFLGAAGCRTVQLLPPAGYWGCLQKSQDPVRKFLVPPVRLLIRLLSTGIFSPLLPSPFSPWLFVLVQK